MEEELSLLKNALICLVVSSPTTMTVSRLVKDYRSMMGGSLPLAKFGYKELVPFLKERCTDIFVVEGPLWDPILTPKVSKNLAHIDQMVQRQKVQSTAKHKGKRRSVLQPNPPNSSNMVPRSITGSDQPNRYATSNKNVASKKYDSSNTYDAYPKYDASNRYDKRPVLAETDTVTDIQMGKSKITLDNINKENDNNIRHTNHNNENDYASKHHNDATSNTKYNYNEKENFYSNSVEASHPSSALSKFYKKRLPHYNSDMDFSSSDAEQTSKGSAESRRESSTSSTSKQAMLDELKAEIVPLIKDSPDGVWCTDLLRLYKERYGRELKFNRFGHTSAISLVFSMEDRVLISRPAPNGDWLLQDPEKHARGAGAAPARRGPRVAPRALPHEDDGDALPGVDFEPDVFPADCLHYMDGVPGAPLEGLEPGAQLEVLVGEVYSPSHFWMLRVGPQHNLAMETLMDEMTEYYCGEGASRVLARGAIRVGQYCASLYDRDWHRSLIVSVIDSDTVKVRHVDYGTVDTVSVRALKPLRRVWGALPAQAVRARLAAARPAAAGWRWPRAACAWLLQRVRDRRLYAHVLARDPEEDIVETFLIDTSGAEDVCLSRELIRVGHADRRRDSALHSADCYLYPRFPALESGATPNYADICRMLADGITLEYVDAYRRHVPGPWAAPAPGPSAPSPADLPQPLELLRLDDRAATPPAPAPAPAPQPAEPRQTRSPHGARVAPQLPYGYACRAPPGLGDATRGPELRLSEAEWAVLSHLRSTDPTAADWYLLTTAWRAMLGPPPHPPPPPPGL